MHTTNTYPLHHIQPDRALTFYFWAMGGLSEETAVEILTTLESEYAKAMQPVIKAANDFFEELEMWGG
jgi:hypothetical protein